MSQEFDKVSYWRERSVKRFETYLHDSRVAFNELRRNYMHIEGKLSPEWTAATSNIDQAFTEFQNVLLRMGEPKEVHEEKETGKNNQAPETPQGAEQVPTTGGAKANGRPGPDSEGHPAPQIP